MRKMGPARIKTDAVPMAHQQTQKFLKFLFAGECFTTGTSQKSDEVFDNFPAITGRSGRLSIPACGFVPLCASPIVLRGRLVIEDRSGLLGWKKNGAVRGLRRSCFEKHTLAERASMVKRKPDGYL